jgi:spermidine synthase
MRNGKILLHSAAFVSGFGFIIYQIVWTRYLQTIFGVSVYAIAAVLASYMLGYAAGSAYFGKRLDLARSAIRLYLLLEIAIGLYGIGSPWMFRTLSELSVILIQQGLVAEGYSSMIRVLLASTVLLIPTFLMGGALPALIKLYCHENSRIGARAGQMYSLHTWGSVAGAFATGFLMIRLLGLHQTLIIAALFNMLAGLLAYRSSVIRKVHVHSDRALVAAGSDRARKTAAPYAAKPLKKTTLYVILAVFSVSGMTALAYEVYWTRLLSYFFRDTSYDFAIILATFLGGLALGSAIGSRLLQSVSNPIRAFGWFETAIGLAALGGLLVVDRLPYWAGFLQTMSGVYAIFGDGYWAASVIIKFIFSIMVMLAPACMFGAIFPFASHICVPELKGIGKDMGLLNGVNSIGSALGAILSGFLFLSYFGLYDSILYTAFVNVALGAILMYLASSRTGVRRAARSAALLGMTGVMAYAVLPGWDMIRMSISFLKPDQPLESVVRVLHYDEDAAGMTSVVEVVPIQQRFLTTNRLFTQNSSSMSGLEDHRRLAHIPLLLHSNPKETLVVGLGAGVTASGAGEHPVERIDVVEISSGVVKAAEWFAKENGGILKDSRVNVVVEDGRSYARMTDRTYDVIIGDIYFPMSSGASGLYSVDYFRQVSRLLRPEGIYAQWLPVHQLSMDDIRVIAQSFRAVFPSAGLWYGMIGESVPVVGLIGGSQPLTIDVDTLGFKLERFERQDVLKSLKLDSPYLLLSHFIMGSERLAEFSGDAPLNTDNRPIIEFTSSLMHQSALQLGTENMQYWVGKEGDFRVLLAERAREDQQVLSELSNHRQIKQVILNGLPLAVSGQIEEQYDLYKQAGLRYPSNSELREKLIQLEAIH